MNVLAWIKGHLLSRRGRKSLFALLGSVSAILITTGVINADTADQLKDMLGQALAVLTAIVGLATLGDEMLTDDEPESDVEVTAEGDADESASDL